MARQRIEIQHPEKNHEEVALVALKREKAELIKQFANLEVQMKALQEKEAEFRANLQEAMERYNIKSFSIENPEGTKSMTFGYVGATTSTGFDSKKFKEDHPEEYKKYIKVSSRKAYVTAKIKDIKDGTR